MSTTFQERSTVPTNIVSYPWMAVPYTPPPLLKERLEEGLRLFKEEANRRFDTVETPWTLFYGMGGWYPTDNRRSRIDCIHFGINHINSFTMKYSVQSRSRKWIGHFESDPFNLLDVIPLIFLELNIPWNECYNIWNDSSNRPKWAQHNFSHHWTPRRYAEYIIPPHPRFKRHDRANEQKGLW